jgi:hypothetical protein
MKQLFLVLSFLFISAGLTTMQAKVYRSSSHSEQIRSLTVHHENDWQQVPVISMGSDNHILISFDELSHDYKRYAYRIIHCNKDWTRSDLNELEYLEGFLENDVEDYEQSYSTLTLYTHYQITLPNDNVQLKCSGNYALEVYDKDGSGDALLTACFMVFENKTGIDASVTASTDIDFEKTHQQLRLEVRPVGFSFQQPEKEISLTIQQNRRFDNEINQIEPSYVNTDKLVYEHRKELIFDAGNEYRRFETTSYKHSGIGVYKVAFFNPFYNAELFPEKPRLGGYIFDKDQNGRFLIHNTDTESDNASSDYFLVHFSYPMENPFLDGGIYLNGDLVENRLESSSKMLYNFENKAYEKTLLLKQGSYNYQYLFRQTSGGKPTLLRTEGSYWQTENEYHIYVYYRPIGGRYDQLIGFSELKTTF